MNIPSIPTIFLAFIILIIVIRYKTARSEKQLEKKQKNFWSKENESLYARKQEISDDDFIVTNPEAIPTYDDSFYKEKERPRLYRVQQQCHELSSKKMLNMTGMLNSEVRIKYGTSQLDTIETYENNYTSYIQYLSILGSELKEIECNEDAKKVLEEAIHVGADISHVFMNLGELYRLQNDTENLEKLLEKAAALDSLMKNKIISGIKEMITEIETDTQLNLPNDDNI